MKRRKIWWKAVRWTGKPEVYQSATKFAVQLIYSPGQVTEAPVGGVLVFEKLDQALNFLGNEWFNLTIVPVYGYQQVRKPPTACSLVNPDVGLLKEHWKNGTKYGMAWPKGTRAFKRVRVLRNWEGRDE